MNTTATSLAAAAATASAASPSSDASTVAYPGANVTGADVDAVISVSASSRRVGLICELPPPW
jgi:hypothetical protein